MLVGVSDVLINNYRVLVSFLSISQDLFSVTEVTIELGNKLIIGDHSGNHVHSWFLD